MDRRAALRRRYGLGAASLLVGAVLVRILTLRLSTTELGIEGALGLLTLVFVAGATRLARVDLRRRGYLLAVYAAVPSALAGAALWIAAPSIPDFPMITALAYAGILISIDVGAPRPAVVAADVIVLGAFVTVWLTTLPINDTESASLLVAIAFLAGLQLAAAEHGQRARRRLDVETLRGRLFATLARTIGTARDVSSVAAAVLAACHEIFPVADHGWVFLFDETDGLLKVPSVFLSPGVVVNDGPGLELAPGEGLAGTVFSSRRPMLWPTAIDVALAEAALRDENRQRLREMRIRFTKSAVAAPLRSTEGGVIGVLLLTCQRRENAWSADDLGAMVAVADEATRAVERARGHEADVDQALLDSVTGLVSHRQLLNISEKEVARAARSGEPVAVIFSDLDNFKEINDRFGHDTGNRVLAMYANVLRSALRLEDTAARYGGDEFVCVLPGADHEQATTIAGRIRLGLESAAAGDRVVWNTGVTVSCGIAVYPIDAGSAEQLLAAADADLLRAKQRRPHSLIGRARRRVPGESPPSA